jgi:hypothetical protein
MPAEPRTLIVVTGEPGTFAVKRLADGRLIAEDAEGRVLGDLNGDLQPLRVTVGGRPHLLCAGPRDSAATDRVEVDYGDGLAPESCLVKADAWVCLPHSFTTGMRITARWLDQDGRVLWQQRSPPLHADALEPMFGPNWTGYASASVADVPRLDLRISAELKAAAQEEAKRQEVPLSDFVRTAVVRYITWLEAKREQRDADETG